MPNTFDRWRMLNAALVFIVSVTAMGQITRADGIEPTGIYLNAFSGSFSGIEWFQVIPAPEGARFLMTDIRGGGFTATVDANGSVTFDGGSGSFSDADNFTLFPFGGEFAFVCNRVPFTGSDFPLQLRNPPITGNPVFAGRFESRTEFFDPVTGALTGGSTEDLDVMVDGTALRITDPQGLFFQGVFIDENTAAFRDVSRPISEEFASFPDSGQNLGQDVLGELEFEDSDHFSATILLQTLAPLGSEAQTLVRFTARRIDRVSAPEKREPAIDKTAGRKQ